MLGLLASLLLSGVPAAADAPAGAHPAPRPATSDIPKGAHPSPKKAPPEAPKEVRNKPHYTKISFSVSDKPSSRRHSKDGDKSVRELLRNAPHHPRLTDRRTQAGPAARPGQDDMTLDECRSHQEAFSGGGWGKSRFVSCQAHGLHFLKQDCWLWWCTVDAAADADMTNIQYTMNGGRNVDVMQVLHNWSTWGDTNELVLTANVTCTPQKSSGACLRGAFGGPYVAPVSAWAAEGTATRFYDFSQNAAAGWGPDNISYAALNWHFNVPGAAQENADGPDSVFRCDSAGYISNSVGEGCVFPWVTETMHFYAGQSGEAVHHMTNALYHPKETIPDNPNKAIPGSPESKQPLHRTTDQAKIDAHRSVAIPTCEQHWPGYAHEGLQCDEFPFARTLEGADANTRDYSVEPIPAKDNESAGGVEGAFFTNRRIVGDDFDGVNDPFYVAVHP